MSKKAVVKKKKVYHKCPHCEFEIDFPVFYCKVCADHHHVFWQDKIQKDICIDCLAGAGRKAQAYLRSIGKWGPRKGYSYDWDMPEWYDRSEEWRCATITDLWVDNDNCIATI